MDKIDVARNASGLSTVTTGSVIGAEHSTVIQVLSDNAIAIGVVCTVITCITFVVTSVLGLVIKNKQVKKYNQGVL